MSSTPYNVDSTRYSNSRSNSFSSTITELRQRAYINKADTEKYSIRSWVNFVYSFYEQVRKPIHVQMEYVTIAILTMYLKKGDQAILSNDLENAYVYYMKGCR